MSNFLTRTLTGAFYVALMVAGVLWSYWLLAALLTFFATVAGLEYSRMFDFERFQRILLSSGSAMILLITSIYFRFGFEILGWIAIAIFILVPLAASFRKGFSASIMLGLGYVALPLVIMMGIRAGIFNTIEDNSLILLGVLVILWVNDSGAYIIGRWLGKHPMAPVTSPKKTWEGLIGGLVLAGLCTFVLFRILGHLTLIQWLIIYLVTVIFGTMGDLLESAMKRRAGLKDSGTIIPGHGGVLDRIDSLLLSMPFVFAVLVYIFTA